MNKVHFSTVLYFSVFTCTYGGFLYKQHMTHQNMGNIDSASITTQEVKNNIKERFSQNDTFYDIEQTAKRTQDATEQSNIYTPTRQIQAINANYVTENETYHPKTSNAPAIALYTNTASDNGYNTSNLQEDSHSISEDDITNQLRKTITATSTAESDGTEFLPDGSSQEDLFNSKSKNPHVITIEDYRKADISCDASFGGGSDHAILMRSLKGC